MERAIDVAQYVFERYRVLSGGEVIDEMKLHKLLYLIQRESLAITGEPLIAEPFYGWKYGPVSKPVRQAYTREGMEEDDIQMISNESAYIANNVIALYGGYESWKLSEMSHREISWKNARHGVSPDKKGDRQLSLEDIKKDAEKVRPYDTLYDMYYDEFEDAEDLA